MRAAVREFSTARERWARAPALFEGDSRGRLAAWYVPNVAARLLHVCKRCAVRAASSRVRHDGSDHEWRAVQPAHGKEALTAISMFRGVTISESTVCREWARLGLSRTVMVCYSTHWQEWQREHENRSRSSSSSRRCCWRPGGKVQQARGRAAAQACGGARRGADGRRGGGVGRRRAARAAAQAGMEWSL